MCIRGRSSPSGLTFDCLLLGSKLPVSELLPNDCKWHSEAIHVVNLPETNLLWQCIHASILSETSSASSTSIPKYLTVLSSFRCPSNSWQALKFFVFLYISDGFVRRIVCVPYCVLSKPIESTHLSTILPYCRVERWSDE